MLRNPKFIRSVLVANRKTCHSRCLSTKEEHSQRQQENKVCDYDVRAFPAEQGFVRSSPYQDIVIPNLTMDQYVWNNFRDWETKIATVRKRATTLN